MIPMIISGVVVVVLFAAFAFWLKRSFEKMISQKFEQASAKAMRDNLDAVVTLAGKSFQDQTKILHDNLKGKEETFKTLVSELQAQVKNFQQEIKTTELDRVSKFSQLSALLSEQKETVLNLTTSADKLNKVLHTNNLRGQWGERIAEDILKAAGLIEGVHYQRNKSQDTSASRPDYTFFLPDQFKVNLDVKFPVTNLIRAQETQDAAEQKNRLKDFETDVKKRIQEVATRDYINPDERTVDYAILFVPNEAVYAAIHTFCPSLIEIAEEKKVVLAAPFSLMAILKVVHQSFRHFHFEEKIREIVVLIEKLGDDLERFQDRFVQFGEQLEKLQTVYRQIQETSFQKIKSKIEQIERYQLGKEASPQSISNEPVVQ